MTDKETVESAYKKACIGAKNEHHSEIENKFLQYVLAYIGAEHGEVLRLLFWKYGTAMHHAGSFNHFKEVK